MEVDEQDCKIKLEIKEEYENKEDDDYEEKRLSLVANIKEEDSKFKLNDSNKALLNIQTIGSQDGCLLGIDSKTEVDNKEDKELLLCKLENGQPLEDKKKLVIVLKDCKDDPFLICLEDGIFKTEKYDVSVNYNLVKSAPVVSEETSQGNSSEYEELYSEENVTNIECKDENILEAPNNIAKSYSKTKKKYFKPKKFICHYCNKGFPQSDILKYHIMTHTGERPYECNYCCMRFKKETSLKRHLQIHTGKRFSCNECNQKFVSNCNRKLHMLIHENKRQFKCALCTSSFNVRGLLKKHLTTVHSKSKRNGVNIAGTNTADLYTKEEPLKKFECGHCNKRYLSRLDLREHIQNKHMNNKLYNCKICDVISEDRYCSIHKSMITNSNTCSVCKLCFTDNQLFMQHIKNTHPTDKPYGCSVCNASFKNKSNLHAHIEVHHKTNDRKFICDVCNMSFNRETYLKRHIKIHTKSDRKFCCDLCDIKCRSKTDMRRHLDTHFGQQEIGPHQCEFCGKSFSKPSKLIRHLVVHTGERPFKCNLCDKAYKDSGSLKYHQDKHQGKTYKCQCGFLSINEHSFKRHVRQMMCQIKVFSCEVCGKSLTSEKFYKNHMMRFHSEDE